MIRTEGQLVDMAGEEGVQGDVRQLLDKFADEKWRLLRSMTIVAEGPESERRGYSLGHDAIAVALFQWSEAHEKLERERRASGVHPQGKGADQAAGAYRLVWGCTVRSAPRGDCRRRPAEGVRRSQGLR